MDTTLYTEVLKTTFLPYIKSIQGFHFYYNNPLFWVFFMVLFLILEIAVSWSPRKAFFFCVSIASILLGTTWLERLFIDMFTRGVFNLFILKVFSLGMISIAMIYFVFVDNS